jgi:hypothetical protein
MNEYTEVLLSVKGSLTFVGLELLYNNIDHRVDQLNASSFYPCLDRYSHEYVFHVLTITQLLSIF